MGGSATEGDLDADLWCRATVRSTMSLFIGALAFGDGSDLNDQAKLGVLIGSVVSAIAG